MAFRLITCVFRHNRGPFKKKKGQEPRELLFIEVVLCTTIDL